MRIRGHPSGMHAPPCFSTVLDRPFPARTLHVAAEVPVVITPSGGLTSNCPRCAGRQQGQGAFRDERCPRRTGRPTGWRVHGQRLGPMRSGGRLPPYAIAGARPGSGLPERRSGEQPPQWTLTFCCLGQAARDCGILPDQVVIILDLEWIVGRNMIVVPLSPEGGGGHAPVADDACRLH